MQNQEEPGQERVERLRAELAKRAPKGMRREVATAIGISNTWLSDFIEGKIQRPEDTTLNLVDRWLEGGEMPDKSDKPNGGESTRSLARQIDAVLASPDGGLVKVCLIAEISAAYRSKALALAEDNARIRALSTPTSPRTESQIGQTAAESVRSVRPRKRAGGDAGIASESPTDGGKRGKR